MSMSNWEQIKTKVEENDDLLTFQMNELKEVAGRDRLGRKVRDEISRMLSGMGLAHIPKELPKSQNELVRLYKRGTPAGDLIEMVVYPNEINDFKLRTQLASNTIDYANIIEQIRELVAE